MKNLILALALMAAPAFGENKIIQLPPEMAEIVAKGLWTQAKDGLGILVTSTGYLLKAENVEISCSRTEEKTWECAVLEEDIRR